MTSEIQLHGKMGFIRMVGDKLQQMHSEGGSWLKFGTNVLTGSGVLNRFISANLRRIIGTFNNGFQTEVPVLEAFKGRYIIVIQLDGKTHGYQITEITCKGNKTSLSIGYDDPGFDINEDGTSQFMFFPETKWEGTHSFMIDNVDSLYA